MNENYRQDGIDPAGGCAAAMFAGLVVWALIVALVLLVWWA